MIVVFHPMGAAKQIFESREFVIEGQAVLPAVGDLVSFDDPFVSYRVMSRSHHFIDGSLSKVVLGIESLDTTGVRL